VQVRRRFWCYARVASEWFENKIENIRVEFNGFWNDFAVSAGSYVLPFTQLRGYLSFCGHLEKPQILFEAIDAESVARRVPFTLSAVLHEVLVAGVAAGCSRVLE
jgi:hypothetical protein